MYGRWGLDQIRYRLRNSRLLKDNRGQGTVEYAILVGVLVVIAVIVVMALRVPIMNLWNDIQTSLASVQSSKNS
jgi:Flp pilus assembly pilin Flp